MGARRIHRQLKIEELEPRVAPAVYDVGATLVSPGWFETFGASSPGGSTSALESGDTAVDGTKDAATPEWIVQLSGEALSGMTSVTDAVGLFASGGLDVVGGLGMAGQVLVSASSSTLDAAESWLKSNSAIAYFEANGVATLDATPNDPSFSKLWGLNNTGQTGGKTDADIDAPEAWSISTGSSRIVVAVIDTGVDYTHPDLAANIWTNPREIPGNRIDDDHNGFVDDVHGYDFANNDGDPMDDNRHGTHVAGTIGGVGNNGIGVVGVNWTSSIMALKFLDKNGSGSVANAVRAVNYATMMHATYGVDVRLSSNSWGSYGYSQALRDAIAASGNAGMLFVAAAGNDTRNNDTAGMYPASYDLDNIIAVAASDQNDNLASFSNYGATSVDLAAPGVNIYSTTPGSSYASFSGTSMATPHVSGVAALAWSVAPNATRQQIRNAVLAGTDPMASLAGKVATGGRLNAKGTLDQLGSAPVVDVTATDANAAEQGLDPGTFTITRSGSTSSALTVYYAIGGSATNGVDYNALSGSLTISAGATSGVVTVKPIDDTLVETSETVILTLSSSASYKIGTHSSATVVIADNDMPSRTYTSGNVPKTIPDRSMIVSTLTVPDSITISDLNVTVNISHTYDADLDVFLSAPDGTRVELFTDVGGSGDNFANTTLDDEASKSITSGVAPFAGSYRPEGLLSRFDGKNAKGTWVLWVTDDARYDTGRLNSWSISILGQVTATQSQTSSQSTPSNGRRLTSSSAGMLGDLFDVAAVSSLAAIGENSSNLPLGGASQAGGMRFADHGADTPLDPGFSSSVLGGRGTGSGVSFLGTIGQVTPDSGARRFLAQEGNETFGQKGQGTDARALPGTIRRQGPSNFAAGPGGVLGAPHDIVLSSNLEEAVGLLAVRPLGEE